MMFTFIVKFDRACTPYCINPYVFFTFMCIRLLIPFILSDFSFSQECLHMLLLMCTTSYTRQIPCSGTILCHWSAISIKSAKDIAFSLWDSHFIVFKVVFSVFKLCHKQFSIHTEIWLNKASAALVSPARSDVIFCFWSSFSIPTETDFAMPTPSMDSGLTKVGILLVICTNHFFKLQRNL